MGLESGTYVGDLVITNPLTSDPRSEGDDHFRLLKTVLKNTFPNLAGRAWRTQPKAAGYTVVADDNMSVIDCSAVLTLAYTAAATLGNGHITIVRANGGNVTVDPNGAELINGASTLTVLSGWWAFIVCDGTGFIATLAPQSTSVTNLVTTAGSGTDTYTATLSPAPAAYETNRVYVVTFPNANTVAAPTLNLNGLGAKTIKHRTGAALLAGQLHGTHFLRYNGTDFLLSDPRAIATEGVGAQGSTIRVDPAAAGGLVYGADYGVIAGLNCSIAGADPTNDITIAVGEASSDDAAFTSRVKMALTAARTKRIDDSWVVGNNQGGLDGTESVAGVPDNDTWYYIWLIMRPDTGVVDVLFSESSTAPTMPANYTKKRLIGVVRRDTATNRKFSQDDGRIWFHGMINVLNGGTATTDTAVSVATAVPPIAKSFSISAGSQVSTPDSVNYSNDVYVQVASGIDYAIVARNHGEQENAGFSTVVQSGMSELPNTGTFNYRNVQSGTAGRSASIWVHGFKLTR